MVYLAVFPAFLVEKKLFQFISLLHIQVQALVCKLIFLIYFSLIKFTSGKKRSQSIIYIELCERKFPIYFLLEYLS